jgi:hypothetical protein
MPAALDVRFTRFPQHLTLDQRTTQVQFIKNILEPLPLQIDGVRNLLN